MRRFATLALALLLGTATASLRLGEYCDANLACNSGCCYQGVCRASFAECQSAVPLPALAKKMIAKATKPNLNNVLANKIINFSKNQKMETLDKKFKEYLARDIQQTNIKQEFKSKLAANLISFANERAAPAP